jgi:hypothetical protein
MGKLEKIINLLQEYRRDSNDSFIPSIESYIESKCIEEGLMDIKDDLVRILIKTL